MGVNTGALYIIFIMMVLFGFGYIMSGPTPSQTPILTGPEVAAKAPKTKNAQAVLQLYNFDGPTITPPVTGLCKKGGANNHPEALIAIVPPQAQAVSSNGQISLWVSDTKPVHIAPDEVPVRGSGAIRTPGDLGARAPDTYLWEPQLYVSPETLENGGKAYFPNFVKGVFNNGVYYMDTYNTNVIPPDAGPIKNYSVEFVWDVKSIGLTDGTYSIEFAAHDGNTGFGIRCATIRVYTPPASQNDQNKLPL